MIFGEEKNKEKGDRDSMRETKKKKLCLGGAFQVRFFCKIHISFSLLGTVFDLHAHCGDEEFVVFL